MTLFTRQYGHFCRKLAKSAPIHSIDNLFNLAILSGVSSPQGSQHSLDHSCEERDPKISNFLRLSME